MFKNLSVGQIVQFRKIPLGSYLKAHEPYIVESLYSDGVKFRDPRNGGATFENARDINQGEFICL